MNVVHSVPPSVAQLPSCLMVSDTPVCRTFLFEDRLRRSHDDADTPLTERG